MNDEALPTTPEVPRRKSLWLEVGALTGFMVLPILITSLPYLPMVWNFVGLPFTIPYHARNTGLNIEGILTALAMILPIAFIVWTSGDGWKTFGIRRFRAFPDLLIAFVLVVLFLGVQYFPRRLHRVDDFPDYFTNLLVPQGAAVWATIVILAAASAFLQELFFRGYLVSRLEELTGNVWVGVVASAMLFASVHLYTGGLQALIALGMGLALGIAFVGRRSIWPLVLANAGYSLAVIAWI